MCKFSQLTPIGGGADFGTGAELLWLYITSYHSVSARFVRSIRLAKTDVNIACPENMIKNYCTYGCGHVWLIALMDSEETYGQLTALFPTRAEQLGAVSYLLKNLLKDQPKGIEWALTEPDGKVYAYVTLAAEWQHRHMTSKRNVDLHQRGL
jgi:hypothetical protein